jgi:YesN/AraC family two-component response regulator
MAAEKRQARLLYVEDEVDTREPVAAALRRRIETVVDVADGEAGLAAFREQQPDVVVTDIALPRLTGLEMVREMRLVAPKLAVILTSAHSDARYLLDGIELGVDAYVLKPMKFDTLFASIDRCFRDLDYAQAEAAHNAERERLLGELQAALAKVKQLGGLLPICAACKQIRDDQGYWRQIEGYLAAHSEAQFTHSICPHCEARLYGDLGPSDDGK